MWSCKLSKINVLFCLYSQTEASELSEIYPKINTEKQSVRVLVFRVSRDYLIEPSPIFLFP